MSKQHLHFLELPSTQDKLIELVNLAENTINLISTENQTRGRGRSKNTWDHYQNNIAFSCLLDLAQTPTLTSLEIAVQICNFFKNDNISLKWPNDILTKEDEKCGGILIQVINNIAIVGIGLNLGKTITKNESYKTKLGSINKNILASTDYETFPKELFSYIKKNRLSDSQIINQWNTLCSHIDREVELVDDNISRGVFKSIGPFGEAYIEINGILNKFVTGSLSVI